MHPASPSPRRRWSWRDAVGPGLALVAGALVLSDREEERHDVFANRPESPAAEVVGVDTGDQGRAPARPNPALYDAQGSSAKTATCPTSWPSSSTGTRSPSR